MMRFSLPLPGLTKIIYYTTAPARSRTRTEASVSPGGGGVGRVRRVRLTLPLSHRQPLDDEEMQNTSNFSTANRARGSHQDSVYQSQLFL